MHFAYLAVGLNWYDCVLKGISDPPLTEYRTHPIKYLNRGQFWGSQTLGGHGHSGGYDQLLFGRLGSLTADIMDRITDYARLVLKDQQNRNRSIEHRFN